MSGLVGALSEAWAELRHHKLRVLLSLIGIAVAVGAIATVFAFGDYMRQSTTEQSDRYSGRAATITVSATPNDGTALDVRAFTAQVNAAAERFGISHVTRRIDQLSDAATVQTSEYLRPVLTNLADPDFGTMHRTKLLAGRWFTDDDASLLAPPVILSQSLWQALGSPSLAVSPRIELGDPVAGTYRLVGVTPAEGQGDTQKIITLLTDTYLDRAVTLPDSAYPLWELWVGPEKVKKLGPELAAQLRAAVGDAVTVTVTRADWASQTGAQDAARMTELVSGLTAGLVLLLGGLGLVNIQLVAMRQRIREIGVRRSFGATGGRIFTTVLLENVVATAVAGVAGIALAIVTMRLLFAFRVLAPLQDNPPFPMRAALIALAAAVAIGAIAGFLPALAAVRAKVIDALRF